MTVDTSLDYDTCLQNLEALADYYSRNIQTRNEATTRLHLIDSLVVECLGWAKHDAYAEEPRDKEFSDYTFFAPRRIMILEAKREGDYFEVPVGKTGLTYSIKTLCRGNPALHEAVEQVAGYCQRRGVPIGAFSNGHQLVAFVATRGDGVPPLDGKCVVFPSLPFMLKNFLDLWNLLSKQGLEEKKLFVRLLGADRPKPPPTLAARIPKYPGSKGRNVFQTDLQVIAETVIEDISASNELEERFLRECYCPSGALSQHSLANKSILAARYAAIFDETAPGPTTVPATTKHGVSPELMAESLSRRPILLIGDVGVGKTTFIKRLIKVDAVDVFANAIAVYIDLGSQAMLSTDLQSFVLDEVARQLEQKHNIDIEAGNFVKAVYHSDLTRFQKGIHAPLRDSDPALYRQKEISFLEAKLAKKSEHLRASLEHLSKARKQQVVVFLDNADQRPDTVQDAAFLIAQEMAERWPTLVYVTLRPETFHRSAQSGALSGYHPKAFTISPPRTDRVLQNRLEFAISLTHESLPLPTLGESGRVRLSELRKVLRSFLASVKKNYDLLECIDNIAGGNMRIALDLVRGFFGSGHVDTQEIVEKTTARSPYIVSVHQFLRAAIYQDAVYYDPSRSPVANVFDVSTQDAKEHFLLPLLLGMLRNSASDQDGHGFVEAALLYQWLQALGFTPDQIDFALVRAFRRKLIETPASRSPDTKSEPPGSFRVTTIGLYHLEKLPRMFAYVDAMTVVTPVFDQEMTGRIADAHEIMERLHRGEVFRSYLDQQWDDNIRAEQKASWTGAFDWEAASSALKADMDHIAADAKRRRR